MNKDDMIIDLSYLKEMSEGNVELMIEMIGIFKEQVLEFSNDMDRLLEKKEYVELGKLAHKAKSSISIMGMGPLAKKLKEFELLAKSHQDIEVYPEFISIFKRDTQIALNDLKVVLSNQDEYLKS